MLHSPILAAMLLHYWVGFQHAIAHLRDRPEAVPFNLCITELLRREERRHLETRSPSCRSVALRTRSKARMTSGRTNTAAPAAVLYLSQIATTGSSHLIL